MDTEFFRDKVVLVTGGTGTFGYAFVRRLLTTPVKKIIIFSRDEYKQHQMRQAVADPEGRLRFFLGDIRDKERLVRAFGGVDIVVHAAALKQVPALEYNPNEAIKTNITGTQNVIEAALDAGIEKVLVISSDKAVQPINLYGATKLAAEKLTVAANAYRKGPALGPRFSVMRYGNILGSRGSFLELIEKQRETGTITLTDGRMTRFWIHIEDIMDLVLEVLEGMHGGEIFVPKMESLLVVDVIHHAAPECKVVTVGIRPGEKLHEALITEHESPRTLDIGTMYAILPEHLTEDMAPKINGTTVSRDFVFASDSPQFLRGRADAARILVRAK